MISSASAAAVEIQVSTSGDRQAAASLARVDDAVRSSASTAARLGPSFAMAANAAVELGQKAIAAAKALVDFAKSGAQANAMAARFTGNLGRLREAVAGTIDDTSLQIYHELAIGMGLTSAEAEGLSRRMTAASLANRGQAVTLGELKTALKGGAESFAAIGIKIDASSKAYAGLTEGQKKLQIAREQAAIGEKAQIDSSADEVLAIARAETAWANLISTLQQTTATAIESSGILERIEVALNNVNTSAGEAMPSVASLAGSSFAPLLAIIDPLVGLLAELGPVIELIALNLKALGAIGQVALKIALLPIRGALKIALLPIRGALWLVTEAIEALEDLDISGWLSDAIPGWDGLTEAVSDAAEWLGLAEEETGDLAKAQRLATEVAKGFGWELDRQAGFAAKLATGTSKLSDARRALYGESRSGAAQAAQAALRERELAIRTALSREMAALRAVGSSKREAIDLDLAMERGLARVGDSAGYAALRLQHMVDTIYDASLQARGDGAFAWLPGQIDRATEAWRRMNAEATKSAAHARASKIGAAYAKELSIAVSVLGDLRSTMAAATAEAVVGFGAAIAAGGSFAESLAATLAPLFDTLGTALLSAAQAYFGLFSGQWWLAAAAAVALGVASAALSKIGGGKGGQGSSSAGAEPAAPPRSMLSRPEETSREVAEQTIIIVQLDVDGESLAKATVGAANRAIDRGAGLKLSSRGVGSVSRYFATGGW